MKGRGFMEGREIPTGDVRDVGLEDALDGDDRS
jgi:hypothetical protein